MPRKPFWQVDKPKPKPKKPGELPWGVKIPIKPKQPSLEDLLPAEEEPEPEKPRCDVLPPIANEDEEG